MRAFLFAIAILLAGCDSPETDARSSFWNYIDRCDAGTVRFSRVDGGDGQIIFEAACKVRGNTKE